MIPASVPDRRLHALAAAGSLSILAYLALWALVAEPSLVLIDVLYQVPVVVALGFMLWAAVSRRIAHRRFWAWFAPGVALKGLGDLVWIVLELAGAEPTPSPADVLYVAGLLLMVVAMFDGLRAFSRIASLRSLLDASVLATAIVSAGIVLVIGPGLHGEVDAALVLAVTYNVLGVIALLPAIVLCAGSRRGVPTSIAVVAAGLVAMVLGDAAYTYLEARNAYGEGSPVDVLWMAFYWLSALGALIALRERPRSLRPARDLGLGLILGGFVTLVALRFVAGGGSWLIIVSFAATFVLIARLMLTARETRRIADDLAAALAEQERLAVTDPLTGCSNRAFVEEVLRLATARPQAQLGVLSLVLDGGLRDFEGRDRVVRAAADALRAAARHDEVIGRSGPEEFLVIVPGGTAETTRAAGERLRTALAGAPLAGEVLGVSVGVAAAPDHATTSEGLLHAAERARETAAALGGNQVRASGDDEGLERIADEVDRRRGAAGHSRAVAASAAAVAEHLGLDAAAQRRCALAGRLHDIGLIAVPDTLLCRPSANEGEELRRHAEVGARIAAAVDPAVAGAIAAQHRPLADDPPPEAAVIAVCNAWARMREGRPGRPASGLEASRARLIAGSGTEFDPAAVRAFLHLEARGTIVRNAEERLPGGALGAADDVLTATAAATAVSNPAPSGEAPGTPRRSRRGAFVLAAGLLVLLGWSGWIWTLHERAEDEGDRAVALLSADRALHEIELIRWRALTGDLPVRVAVPMAEQSWAELTSVAATLRDRRLDAALYALGLQLMSDRDRALTSPALDAVERARFTAELERVDDLVDGHQSRAEVAAEANGARAARLTAGTGALALLLAGLLLWGFARSRRATQRLRTEAARAEGERTALRDTQRRFRALVQHASDAVAVIDDAGAITFVTDSIEPLLGHTATALRGRLFRDLVADDDRPRLAELLAAARGMPQAMAGELSLRHCDGHPVFADLRVADRSSDPDVAGVVLTLRDVSEQRRLESQLRQSVLRDRRTGLPNRTGFEQALQDALARGDRVAALLIDLDDFKTVNDSLGHAAGDRCLEVVAERLREAVGDRGHLARVGGDEFGVLLERVSGPAEAEALARRVLDAIRGAVGVDGEDVPLTASAGIALAAAGDLAEDLLRSADTAAHAAKARGAGSLEVYTPVMHEHAVRQLALRTALARAIDRQELELAYQPVVDLLTGEPSSVEALLRWRTREGVRVPPADFIPVAEASGLVVPLGAWVLERACTAVAPLGDLTVAVNVSAMQLRTPDFVSHVATALERSGLPARRLVLELTESAVMDDVAGAQAAFTALGALGVQIAIDDFGTGFSSLASLASLPVDLLKLDRGFVAAMSTSAPHEAMVGGVVSLADRLGLPLVAEGVETPGQLEALRALGCRYGQGFHLGRPGPLAAVDAGARSLR
jgi:diguanylate cyclase (GGDEF)-like protein/PAS domain S-box-containing protein